MGRSSTARKSAPRDAASKMAQQRLSVLELARELGNVAEACRQRGMDRTSFYEWKRRFQTQGFAGLKDLPPIHRSHPQTTPPETVEKIKALALAHPAYGCNRHEAMLALEGIRVSAITIQKILNENGLGTKIDRWLALDDSKPAPRPAIVINVRILGGQRFLDIAWGGPLKNSGPAPHELAISTSVEMAEARLDIPTRFNLRRRILVPEADGTCLHRRLGRIGKAVENRLREGLINAGDVSPEPVREGVGTSRPLTVERRRTKSVRPIGAR